MNSKPFRYSLKVVLGIILLSACSEPSSNRTDFQIDTDLSSYTLCGEWASCLFDSQSSWQLYELDGNYVSREVSANGYVAFFKIYETEFDGNRAFTLDLLHQHPYGYITKEGDLTIYDDDGYVGTVPKLK